MSWSFVCFVQAQRYLALGNTTKATQWYHGQIYASFKETETTGIDAYLNRPEILSPSDLKQHSTIQGIISTAANQEPWKGLCIVRNDTLYKDTYPLQYLPHQ